MILLESKKQKKDYRELTRTWIQLFEESEIDGWDRDEFLDCMIKCKEEKNDKK